MSAGTLTALLVGDIVGRAGRCALDRALRQIVQRHRVDFVVANGENAAAGMGLTPTVAIELFDAGVDVLTSGNHIWGKKEMMPFLEEEGRVLRPANYPAPAPGRGSGVFTSIAGVKVGVLNLEGRVFMNALDCPFLAADREIERLSEETKIILADFHAETTSEKMALGYYLDGRVSVLAGTHTHVQTADERILPQGSAYITDLGMTGGWDGVIGFQKEKPLQRFLTQRPVRFEPACRQLILNGLVAEIDIETGRALRIERVFEHVPGEVAG